MIPVAEPLIARNAKKYVLEALSSGWISSKGPFVEKFEEKFAKFIGVRYGISTTSGTASLHLALSAIDIGPGDEVIVTAFTMISPVFTVIYLGAKPVFVDSEFETWNMDLNKIEELITPKTKAIIAVHIYGYPINMDRLRKIARKHKLIIIEDAAEALGAKFKDKNVGSFGTISCFSFYANKSVTTGEGGMVVTDNPKLAEKLRILRDMAHSPKKRFLHASLGYTYRFTNLQACLGLAQLEQIDNIMAKKKIISAFYDENLKDIKGLSFQVKKPWAENVCWMFTIMVNKKSPISRDKLRKELFKKGVETRGTFIPMNKQPIIKNLGLINKNIKFPVAESLSSNGFYLPSGPKISIKELEYIASILKNIL